MDLNTQKGLAEFFDRRRAEVAREFKLFGKLPRPKAWLVHTRAIQMSAAGRGRDTPPSTEVLDEPKVTDMHCPEWLLRLVGNDTDRARELYTSSIRAMAKHAHAIGFIMISQAELTATSLDTGERLEQKKALICIEETTRVRRGYTADIIVAPDDARIVGPWVALGDEADAELSGGMTQVVPGAPPVGRREHAAVGWLRSMG